MASKLTQHQLFEITGYTELPWNMKLRSFQLKGISETGYYVEVTRQMFIEDQKLLAILD